MKELLKLSLRFARYFEILSWRSASSGASEGDFDLSGAETLERSSADFDHALREIDRRSPVPLFDGVKDLDDEGVAGREGMGSNEPGFGKERSKTDLRGCVSTRSQHQGETTDVDGARGTSIHHGTGQKSLTICRRNPA